MLASSSSTTLQEEPGEARHKDSNVVETLTLRLVPRRKKKGVKWSQEVVDNEFLGKKSSKKCCIFHKQRVFGEWSDGEDSDQECCKPPITGSNNDDAEAGSTTTNNIRGSDLIQVTSGEIRSQAGGQSSQPHESSHEGNPEDSSLLKAS
ncbi:hypothetical protein CEUSTIGMA_g11352.t1 [Chlamydomonas eustigma]|uniref:Protein phosphatase 1 regulatory subunit 11 n=1 Tax=Chlamydomonas eustigma TaxID=1157962 RepID=A0A250XLH0_9CHLO|nr:hypothetical protein CEUSTIGMA_g11352.t1 [Chlamydomonas eustigma]|eukprot:GAX83928.1 hypothetical protein CEUSTIGMA_g11352.t1 [Chlamydomonas eustigma]